MAQPRILIVGSVNMDIVARVDHTPVPGENVRGWDLATIPGGKGANQAVACARLGARTDFLARVGDDEFGGRLRRGLAEAGVRTEAVAAVAGCPSGIAVIFVDARGQNSIVVTAGANDRLTPDDVDAARGLMAEADAVLLQLEVPPETVARAIGAARRAGVPVIVDAGPPRQPVDEAVFGATILSPNEAEAASLLGIEPGSVPPEAMAQALSRGGRRRSSSRRAAPAPSWPTAGGSSASRHSPSSRSTRPPPATPSRRRWPSRSSRGPTSWRRPASPMRPAPWPASCWAPSRACRHRLM